MKKCFLYFFGVMMLMTSFSTLAEKGCELTYFAKTADHAQNVFVCSNQSNIIFAYGSVEATKPEILLVVPKTKVLIKTYQSVKLGPIGYEMFIPNGGVWYVVSSKLLESKLLLISGGSDIYQAQTENLDNISSTTLDKVDEKNQMLSVKGVLNITEDINVR